MLDKLPLDILFEIVKISEKKIPITKEFTDFCNTTYIESCLLALKTKKLTLVIQDNQDISHNDKYQEEETTTNENDDTNEYDSDSDYVPDDNDDNYSSEDYEYNADCDPWCCYNKEYFDKTHSDIIDVCSFIDDVRDYNLVEILELKPNLRDVIFIIGILTENVEIIRNLVSSISVLTFGINVACTLTSSPQILKVMLSECKKRNIEFDLYSIAATADRNDLVLTRCIISEIQRCTYDEEYIEEFFITAYYMAIKNNSNSTKIPNYLRKHPLNLENDYNYEALCSSIRYKNNELVDIILSSDTTRNLLELEDFLYISAFYGNEYSTTKLLQKDIGVLDKCIYIAAEKGHLDVVEILHKHIILKTNEILNYKSFSIDITILD